MLAGAPQAHAQTVPPAVSIEPPPGLDLQQMMQAIEMMKQSRERVTAQPQGVAPEPSAPVPAVPIGPLPSELAPLSAEPAPAPVVALPSELTPFTEPPPQAPENGGDGVGAPPAPGLPSPGALLGTDDEALAASPEIQALMKLFQDEPSLANRSTSMRAQTLAVNFVDYVFRKDQSRIRALVGVPFYADNFPVDTEADLNKLLGPLRPISGPPKPTPEERKNDELIGASVMRIEELRNTEFYIGDRGADLIGLKPDDFFIHLVFVRNGVIAPMVVYVRQVDGDNLEVAGFYD